MTKYNKTYDECYFLNYSTYDDMSLYEIGQQRCPPSYSFGPIIRDHYVLHYIINGTGKLYLDHREFNVHAHEAFLMPPNLLCYYEASAQDPWNYIWIHIDGSRVPEYLRRAGIDKHQPIFRCAQDSTSVEALLKDICNNYARELYCIGKLYELFEFIVNCSDTKIKPVQDVRQKYVNIIRNFIRLKYNESITIETLSDACGLERSYMTRLFKEAVGHTPQEYLIHYRMRVARKLLCETDWSIRNIAYAVGYGDSFAFSKAFKRVCGAAPSQYRDKAFEEAPPDPHADVESDDESDAEN